MGSSITTPAAGFGSAFVATIPSLDGDVAAAGTRFSAAEFINDLISC
jgi:hypothetical protein